MAIPVRSFVMLGPPASGKGTQGRLLAEEYGLAYLSTGSRLRREIEEKTELGREAQTYLDQNQYVPDALAIKLISTWLAKHPEGWLLDGFPRSVPQAEVLLEMLSAPFLAIHLEVSVEELRRRVVKRRECPSCGPVATEEGESCPNCGAPLKTRADDSREGFEKRLQAYQELTIPSVAYLAERDCLLRIDGSGSREEVAQLIRERLS